MTEDEAKPSSNRLPEVGGANGAAGNPGARREDMLGSARDFPPGKASVPVPRPQSTLQEYHRVMFLARLVLGFSGLAAFTLGGIAIYTGRGYESIPIGLMMLIGALAHYFWVRRAVKRDMSRNFGGDS